MHIRALALMALAVLFPSLSSFHAARTSNHSSVLSEAAETRTATGRVPAPEEVLGFRPGDDRRLASWREVVEYFRRLDAASERVQFAELGKTTMGAPFVMATISAPENLARLEEYRKIQEQLADPRLLGPNPDARARQLIARGKTIVLITCGIHSTEVGSYLSSMLIAHRLASADDPLTREILRNTIVLLVPSLNPDGVDIVKNWYDKTRGTPYEGTDPPELYHKYTGHDNNRDWYAFTQVETRITVERIHNVWHPQIVHDIHQQGAERLKTFSAALHETRRAERSAPDCRRLYGIRKRYRDGDARRGLSRHHDQHDLRRMDACACLLALSRRRTHSFGNRFGPNSHARQHQVR